MVDVSAEVRSPRRKMSKDIKTAALTLTNKQAQYLVDMYYIMQDYRIASGHRVLALDKDGEPNDVIKWLKEQNEDLEGQVRAALDKFSTVSNVGQWLRSQLGIGPVIAAGMIAHLDITVAPTAGHFWSYAGLLPDSKRKRGEKIKWNPDLKRLCWLLGESFVKVSGKEDAFYAQIYKQRKEYETAKNEAGDYADQAAKALKEKNYKKETDAYKAYSAGKLPLAHIHSRAKRYAVKIFLSHLHHVMFVEEYGKEPPKPFAIEHLGHAHLLPIPNYP